MSELKNDLKRQGQVDYILVKDNIKFESVDGVEYEDTYVKIGENGMLKVYKSPIQDDVWTDENNIDGQIGAAFTQLFSLICDKDLTSSDSTYGMNFNISNNDNRTRTITLETRIEGTLYDTKTLDLDQRDDFRNVFIDSVVGNTITAGDEITVWIKSDGNDITIHGNSVTNRLKVTKAAAVVTASQLELENAKDNAIKAIIKAASGLNGFDREAMRMGGKQNGILEYCHEVSSGEVHIIGSDEFGTYTVESGRTTFADGSPLVDRTLSIYHDAGETMFSYWYHGAFIKVTDAKKIQIPVGFDGYVYFNDDGELEIDPTKTEAQLIKDEVVVAIVNINSAGEFIWYADERHGILQDGEDHLQQHISRGFYLGDKNSLAYQGASIGSATYTGFSEGVLFDEDVEMYIEAMTHCPKLYKLGPNFDWTISHDDNYVTIINPSTNKAQWNDLSGTEAVLTDVNDESNNDKTVAYLLATNNKLHPLLTLIGQELYTDSTDARHKAPSAYARVETDGLPSHEFRPIYSVIVNKNGEILAGADGELGWDYRGRYPVMQFS